MSRLNDELTAASEATLREAREMAASSESWRGIAADSLEPWLRGRLAAIEAEAAQRERERWTEALTTMTDAARAVLYVYGDSLQSRSLNALANAVDAAHGVLMSPIRAATEEPR